jgi:hypothetical protein
MMKAHCLRQKVATSKESVGFCLLDCPLMNTLSHRALELASIRTLDVLVDPHEHLYRRSGMQIAIGLELVEIVLIEIEDQTGAVAFEIFDGEVR